MLLMGRFTEAAAGIDQALHRGASAHPAEAMRDGGLPALLALSGARRSRLEDLRSPLERLEADRPDDKIYPCYARPARLRTRTRTTSTSEARHARPRTAFDAVQRDAASGCWRSRCWPRSRPWWETRSRSRRSTSCCVRIPARRRRWPAYPHRIRVAVPRQSRCCPLPARRGCPIPSGRGGSGRPDRRPALERPREG